jgi:hypothetical protein
MKKNFKRAFTFFLIFCLTMSVNVYALGTPGSANDPLVSQGYVDQKFEQLLAEYAEMLDLITRNTTVSLTDIQFDAIVNDVTQKMGQNQAIGSQTFTPVQLFAGQILLGGEGTEVILQSGIALARAPGANGLTNVTAGTEVMNGEQLQNRHLLIIPRADGRGVRASTDIWLLVKGSYTIQ